MTTLSGDFGAPLDDRQALSRYAETGDPRAFEVLVHRYQAMVLATCRRTLGGRAGAGADAEDATQEAFLRLAQHAGSVTSNAAAWLHACAVRTSIDLLRKRGTQAKAERRAGELAGEGVTRIDSTTAEWHEIEPMLDEAISKLSDADRELIVGRFLAGRSQKEMAEEAGVNPGTMHRRIDKALATLRKHLRSSGLAVTGSLGVTIAAGAAGTQVSPALTGSLVKAGLVGLANAAPAGGAATGLGVKLGVAAAIGVLGVATVGVATMSVGSGGGGAASIAGVVPAPGPGAGGREVERPKRATAPIPLSHNLFAGNPRGSMRFEGDRLVYEDVLDMSGRPLPGGGGNVVFRILDSRRGSGVERLTLRIDSTTMPDGSPFALMLGSTIEATFEVRDGRLLARAEPPPGVDGVEDLSWMGTRPPDWHEEAVTQADLDAAPLAPGLGGAWFVCDDFRLVLDSKDVTLRWQDWTVHRFRILEWDPVGTHTRIWAICADSMNPTMVGERVRLLLRADEGGGYTISMRGQNSGRLDEWPEGFGVMPDHVLMSFGRED